MIWLVLLTALSLLLGISLKRVNIDKRQKLVYVLVMFTLMTLLCGLRDVTVGLDTPNYYYLYQTVRDKGIAGVRSGHYESGFLAYVHLLSRIFHHPKAFTLISSALIFTAFGKTVYRYSEDVVLSTFTFIIWFYTSTFNIMRQYLSLAIVLLGIGFIFQKKPIKYLITVLLAASFHQTAILFAALALFAIKRVRLNNRIILLISALFCIVISQFDRILNIFLAVFPRYNDLMMSEAYTEASELNLFWITIFALCAVITMFYHRNRLISVEASRGKIWFASHSAVKELFLLLFVISIFCLIMTSKLWIASRINSYFRFSLIFILPYAANFLCSIFIALVPIGQKRQKICITAVYTVFYVVLFAYGCYMFAQDGHGILPYTL